MASKYRVLNSSDPRRYIFFSLDILKYYHFASLPFLSFVFGHAFLSRVETTRGIRLCMKL